MNPRSQSTSAKRNGFTLIELLVVIAIIAILSVVVILTLNPAQLLEQSRDSNRLSDLSITNTALGTYLAEGGNFLGSSNLVYISVPDPSATSSAGDNCQGLNLPTAPSGTSYFCGASTTYRNTDGTGWIPVNFSSLAGGSPLGQLPQDPINQTSSGLYYTYATNGTQYEVTALPESQKYLLQYEQTPVIKDYPGVLASGNNLTIDPLFSTTGLVGYWPFEEGSGSSTADASGNGNGGTWNGSTPYYSGGKVGTYAGDFNGSSFIGLNNPSALQITAAISASAWVYPTALPNYQRIIANYNGGSVNNGPFVLSQNGSDGINCNLGSPNFFAGVNSPTNSFGTTNTWYDVTCTYSGSLLAVYINGVLEATTTTSGSLSYSYGYPWFIGTAGSSTATVANKFSGLIDDVRVYSRALSASEVQALYNAEN
jgi:prepilin-type N-terminal cleavage/methylation domain-containing protein